MSQGHGQLAHVALVGFVDLIQLLAEGRCSEHAAQPLIEVRDLKKTFRVAGKKHLRAVDLSMRFEFDAGA